MIVHLGTHPTPDTFYLLVITDEKDKTPEYELLNKIETNCRLPISVCAIVHKSDAFLRGINTGCRFFNSVLAKSKVAYHSADLKLRKLQDVDIQHIKIRIEENWKRGGCQGKDFLDAAFYCYDESSYNLLKEVRKN